MDSANKKGSGAPHRQNRGAGLSLAKNRLKQRLPYLIAFFTILAVEICIGAFVHDRFIRPYVGDILVAVLLCCLIKAVWPRLPLAALWVLLLCVAAETIQLLNLPARLGLQDTVLEIALGATFDWKDLVCYLTGCTLFAAVTCRKGSAK